METSAIGDFLSPLSFQEPPVLTPSGWIEHGPFAAWLIEATRPNLLVELGTHWGYSFFAFCEAVKTLGLGTRCVAVDTWEGDEHAGFYDGSVFEFVRGKAAAYPESAVLRRMRFDEALATLDDGSIDLLHIDGRHRYEDAAEDFTTYLPKLSSRGVVIMHDIVVRERGFGVWQHWDDVKRQYPTFEFRHGNGLGVVAVGPDVPPAIRALTELPVDSPMAELVRATYGRLGLAITVEERKARTSELEATLEATRAEHADDVRALARQALGRQSSTLRSLREREAALRTAERLTPALLKDLVRGRLRAEGVRLLNSDTPDETTVKQLADLFDPEFYAAQHPELSAADATFEHYLEHGWPADESPTPLFDRDWYVAVNPDVVQAGVPALAHYLGFGDAEGRDPNAVFDSSWYRLQHPDLFGAGDLALVVFVTEGRRRGHDPSPAFATTWYLERYPEAAASGRIALTDYLTDGALQGRDPHPDFDTSWYIAAHVDVCRDGTNPLVHYLTFGLEEGRTTTAAGAHLCRN